MMTKEGFNKIVIFMTPGAGVLVIVRGHISHIVKMHYSYKKSSSRSTPRHKSDKLYIMMTKKESTKIVTFMTPGAAIVQGVAICPKEIFFSTHSHRSDKLSI